MAIDSASGAVVEHSASADELRLEMNYVHGGNRRHGTACDFNAQTRLTNPTRPSMGECKTIEALRLMLYAN